MIVVYKVFKKEKGVSPIIGTILMIAITVVLASVLLMYVYLTPSATYKPHITGMFASVDKIVDGSYKLTFSRFSYSIQISSLKGVISIDNTEYHFNFSNSYNGAKAEIWPQDQTVNGIEIIYHDLANNTYINQGDYLIIKGLKKGITYEVSLLYANGELLASTTIKP